MNKSDEEQFKELIETFDYDTIGKALCKSMEDRLIAYSVNENKTLDIENAMKEKITTALELMFETRCFEWYLSLYYLAKKHISVLDVDHFSNLKTIILQDDDSDFFYATFCRTLKNNNKNEIEKMQCLFTDVLDCLAEMEEKHIWYLDIYFLTKWYFETIEEKYDRNAKNIMKKLKKIDIVYEYFTNYFDVNCNDTNGRFRILFKIIERIREINHELFLEEIDTFNKKSSSIFKPGEPWY